MSVLISNASGSLPKALDRKDFRRLCNIWGEVSGSLSICFGSWPKPSCGSLRSLAAARLAGGLEKGFGSPQGHRGGPHSCSAIARGYWVAPHGPLAAGDGMGELPQGHWQLPKAFGEERQRSDTKSTRTAQASHKVVPGVP